MKRYFIEDAVHGQIEISEFERKIVYSTEFNRLHDIYQNSTLYLTFPTNRVKRFEHCIGTMKLAGDMLNASVMDADRKILDLFYDTAEEIIGMAVRISDTGPTVQEFYGPDHISTIVPFSDILKDEYCFRGCIERNLSLIPSNVEERYRLHHLIVAEAVRLAGLLHDVGHPPFSHITENALSEKSKFLPEFMQRMNSGNRHLHEQMGLEISEHILSSYTQTVSEYKEIEVAISILALGILSDGEFFEERIGPHTEAANFCKDLHSIIDSSFDADRLDYVTRDALNSGRSHTIDYNRILQNMRLCRTNPECKELRFRFCPSVKVVGGIEEVLFARYDGYVFVVYHHHSVKTNFILGEVIKGLIELNKEPLVHEIRIPENISGLWWLMADNLTQTQKSFALCQWNDSWLMTMLKKVYFEGIGTGELYKMPDILRLCLTELVTNRKCIFTLIKRKEHYKKIDDRVVEALKMDDITSVLSRIPSSKDDGLTLYLRANLLDSMSSTCSYGGFATIVIRDILRDSPEFRKRSVYDDYCSIPKRLEHSNKGLHVVMNGISTGVSRESPIFVCDITGKPQPLCKYSGIGCSLESEIRGLPWFYLFSESDVGDHLNQYLASIGDEMAVEIHDLVLKLIERKAS